MKRMTCIGAQVVPVAEMTAPLHVVEMPCRRAGATDEQRTFTYALPMQEQLASPQLPLFEDRPAHLLQV